MKASKILILVFVLGLISCNDNGPEPTAADNNYLIIEAESYSSIVGEIRLEEKPNASDNTCVHIGPDSDNENEGIGDALIYDISLERDFPMSVFEVWYSDDVGGNIIHVYLDDTTKGCFRTETTGGWNNFELDSQKINLGWLNEGDHTLKVEMTKGGSWGVLLDYFMITKVEHKDLLNGAYNYVESLINPNTGLVKGADYDYEFTTVYKNALTAMAFIHENDLNLATGIFDFFNSRFDADSFEGFNKNWNPETGDEMEEDHWEGDNAFLLLALNYYKIETESFGDYEEMVAGLRNWLIERYNEEIVAEGVADMYAALKPFENSVAGLDTVLQALRESFYDHVDFENVLDHTMRAALVFSDLSGFDYIDNFERTEVWKYNGVEVTAFAAFSGEDFINVEICAQILLAWKIWKSDLLIDLSYIEEELNKLWLLSESAPDIIAYGMPYYLDEHAWTGCWDRAIIDPVCYMLFYYWEFNPMAPGRKGY